ncbi:unnamed protein product [Protopolystoma xenopodis]|uniref:Uncharacterized protein n=1 Tax=Protopolystoma xenopodis TaxID=117903 RepID=A0A448WNA1_9PLAT|nr:unnamed protein product [Protopolystoma xenopodis]
MISDQPKGISRLSRQHIFGMCASARQTIKLILPYLRVSSAKVLTRNHHLVHDSAASHSDLLLAEVFRQSGKDAAEKSAGGLVVW